MNKLFKTLSIVVLVAIVAVAFAQPRQASAAVSLAYGFTMQDTMAGVEQKLGQPREVHALQAGWELGLPDQGGSPDHSHYWAVYDRFGITVIYNSPSAADKNATVYKILVNE